MTRTARGTRSTGVDEILVLASDLGVQSSLVHHRNHSKQAVVTLTADDEVTKPEDQDCNWAETKYVVPKAYPWPLLSLEKKEGFKPLASNIAEGDLIYLIKKTGANGDEVTMDCSGEGV